jgi:hypothetical protein
MSAMGPIDELASQIAGSPHTDGSRESILEALRVSLRVRELEVEDLEYAIRRHLAEHANLVVAIERILDAQTAAYLANEIAGSQDYCPINADSDTAINKLLTAVGIQPIVWDIRFQGVYRIGRRLGELHEEMMQKKMAKSVLAADLQRFGIVGWNYLETLLKVSLRFYAKAFGTDKDTTIGRAFGHALRCRNLMSLVEAIKGIENGFGEVPLASRECKQKLERSSPFQGLLDGMLNIEERDVSDEWVAVYNKLAKVLYRKHEGENLPVERLHKLRTDVQVYRNFFAHADEKAVEEAGWQHALSSLNAARHFITSLSDIYPRLVVPVWHGQDAFGRFVIMFVSELDIRDDGSYDISRACRMYPYAGDRRSLQVHGFYLCAPVYDGVFEPVLCSLADVRPKKGVE